MTNAEAWLARTEELLWLAIMKTKAIEEWALSTTVQVVEEYKDSNDFKNDAAKARRDT